MDLVRIKKANKVMLIDRNLLNIKLNEGFDQVDEGGNVVKRATGGRTVSLPEHNKALDELEMLKSNDLAAENEELKKEITTLKRQNTNFQKKIDELEKEK